MENQVNEKIKALINLVYGKTFSEAHLGNATNLLI